MILFVAVLLLFVAPALLWLAGRFIHSGIRPGARPAFDGRMAVKPKAPPAGSSTPPAAPWYSRPPRPIWGKVDRG